MFTGLIATVGTLVALEKKAPPRLTLRAALSRPLNVGDSLAVNGVCLTLVEKSGDRLSFQLAAPTLRLSNLQDLAPGSPLNVEPPLTLNDPLGGHLVSGHIDGTARLRSASRGGSASRWTFAYREREWRKFLVARGSVALNGVSLTVVDAGPGWFAVELIPQTLKSTNLGRLRPGERVNVELDMLARYLFNFQKRS